MSPQPSRTIIAASALLVSAWAYVASDLLGWPRLVFNVPQGSFMLGSGGSTFVLGYWGQLVWGGLGLLAGAAMGYGLRPFPRLSGHLSAWAISMLIGAAMYITYRLWP